MRVRVLHTACDDAGNSVAVFNFEMLREEWPGGSAISPLPQG
jgi:hypothetical protein